MWRAGVTTFGTRFDGKKAIGWKCGIVDVAFVKLLVSPYLVELAPGAKCPAAKCNYEYERRPACLACNVYLACFSPGQAQRQR